MYQRPENLAQALEALANGATPLAGGTDLFPRGEARNVVDVSRLPELRGIWNDNGAIRIGAATTWSEIVAMPLPPALTCLQQAAQDIGALQIQNSGTIGGNLCNASPAADGAPPLLALDAEVELAGPRGLRRLPLSDFLLGNRRTALLSGELMTAVIVPRPDALGASAFLKLGARRYLVISIVMAAAGLRIENGLIAEARIAVGAAAPVARRLRALEDHLRGKPADSSLDFYVTADSFHDISPIDDLRATADYRRDAAVTLVRRALGACRAALARQEAA